MEIESHRGMMANKHIAVGCSSYKMWKTFKYLDRLLTNQNSIHEGKKYRCKPGNLCYYLVQILLSSRLLSKNFEIKIYKTIILLTMRSGVRFPALPQF